MRTVTPTIALLCLVFSAEAAAEPVKLTANVPPVIETDAASFATFKLTNPNDQPIDVSISWSLHLNSQFNDILPPDPVLGADHAVDAKSSLSIGGVPQGDSLLTDGDEHTAFESAWTNGHGDAMVDIDLGTPTNVTAMRWLAADANWIWLVDVSASVDGQAYEPVPSLQGFDMHKKWSLQSFPVEEPFTARHLRLRFYKPDSPPNIVRLPASLQVFDGATNDTAEAPEVGPTMVEGKVSGPVPASGTVDASLPRLGDLAPGCYLLKWRYAANEETQNSWAQLLVMPTDEVDKDATRRFGFNGSDVKHAEPMSRCGFGWVRFENAKWMMYSTAPDRYAFDGSVAPWHVDQDSIYAEYNRLGMKVLPYIFQTPEYANSAGPEITVNRHGYPPRQAADYGEAVFQLLARFAAKEHPPELLKTADDRSGLNLVHAVELWNEPNLVGPSWAAFVGPLETYFDVMRAGAEAARRADPSLPITSAGWAGIAVATVDKMRTHKYSDGKTPLDLVDIINVHFYSGRQEPEIAIEDPNVRAAKPDDTAEMFPQQIDALVKWRDEHKPSAGLWLTETGNDVGGPIGLSERKQAAKLPRVMMIALSRGIDKVFVYRESGSDAAKHAGAGLLRNDGSLRPSWFTVATLIRQLQGFEGQADRLATSDSKVWLLAWRDEGRCVLAAWTIGDATELPIDYEGLLQDGAVLRTVDAFGHERAGEALRQAGPPLLGEFPIYIHLKPDSPAVRAVLGR